ncbi:MAG: cytochrome d ubiquinol oxidase subunit II [Phenylobacterium sp.]|nr:cytochrome d ubiquinol oxidase subunit II [Phenylobacterium sp.]
MTLDLPLIWAAIIAVGVLMYVLLDGMDLGLGILFPFAATPEERDVMMDTVAPVWDGNETCWCWAAEACSPPSPRPTRRCSRRFTCRCC